jgi:hypothetical protein
VADHLKRLKWGFGKKEMKLAVHVRDGIVSRDEAMAQIEATTQEEPPAMEHWLNSLGLQRQDIDRARRASYDGFKTYDLRMLKVLRKYTKLVSFPLEDELN